jgi:predicted nuclease of predicted toxin-antitoxin system
MKYNAPNVHERLKNIDTIRYFIRDYFLRIQPWHKLRKICIRYCPIWFNFHDFFFIIYFCQKDVHYESDIVPIFEQWARLDPALRFDTSLRPELFKKMLINFIDNLNRYDRLSMGRCHLEAYNYSDNRSFEKISNEVLAFNHMVHLFIGHVAETFDIFVRTQLPHIKAYNLSLVTNYYHYSNVVYYFWQVFWEVQNGNTETTLEVITERDTYILRIIPGQDQIAMAKDKNDVEKIRKYLLLETPAMVSWLTALNVDGNEVIRRCRVFTQNIRVILNDHAWNRLIRGRCGWERGFWDMG